MATHAFASYALLMVVHVADSKQLQHLLEKADHIAPTAMSLALRLASAKGYYHCVRVLIPHAKVDETFGGKLTEEQQEYLDILGGCGEDPVELHSFERESSAIELAAENGHLDCLDLLLRASTSKVNRGWALSTAAAWGRVACVERLLQEDSLPKSAIREATLCAVDGEEPACLERLLPFATFKTKAEAAGAAARNQGEDFLRPFLALAPAELKRLLKEVRTWKGSQEKSFMEREILSRIGN